MFFRNKTAVQEADTKLQHELQALRDELATVQLAQPTVECTTDGIIRRASPPFAELLGHPADALADRALDSLLAPTMSAQWRGLWASLSEGRPCTEDLALLASDGTTRWLRLRSVRLAADAAAPRVLCFATDVTALRAELALTATELKVRQDIMNVTSIVSEGDKTGAILNANDKYLEISKYSREELIGHGHNITRHPDMPKAVFKEMWNTIGHGRIFRGVVKNRAKDGSPYYVDAVIAPILGANGKPERYLGVRYDITAAEIERQNSRGVLAAVNDSFGYIEFDTDGHVITANDNFLALLGYRLEEIMGQHHRLFVDPVYAASDDYRGFWTDLNDGKPRTDLFRRFGKGRKEVYIQATYAPVRDEHGRVIKIIKIATDVTAQKHYELKVTELLRAATEVLTAMHGGDLTHRIDGDYEGEFAHLKDAVNGTIANLTGIIGRIRTGALGINSAAAEVAKGNTELSARTEEQASSLEETAASMEEMTSTVQQNAENSRQANQLAASAREQAAQGGEVVSRAVEAMAAINQSSRKIADIIGVIDEIAFQTNLLALNAAVEAARAGEQGRGFAVVASEVRNLAQRSATAAKEIKTLINDSVHKVGEGSRLVDESGRTLQEIVTAVKKVSDIIAEIAVASEEQSSGISQVNTAVTQMDQMTQQNAALVEEAAAASESMDEESRALIEIIGFFKVAQDDAGSTPVERRGAQRPWSGKPQPTVRATRPAEVDAPLARAAAAGDTWSEF